MAYPADLPSFEGCGIAAALEAIGERWSFLILRGALNGLRHFEEFQATLGIARNILANRLAKLVDKGILVRRTLETDRRKVEYRLTEKGEALLPVMLALRQWGEAYDANCRSMPVLCDRRDGEPIQPIAILSHDGRRLTLKDLLWQQQVEARAKAAQATELAD